MEYLQFRKLVIYTMLTFFLVSCYRNNTPTSFAYQRIEVTNDSVGVQNEVQGTIALYKDKVDAETTRIIGYSGQTLIKGKPESPLTNFTSDLLLESGVELAGKNQWPVPQVSFVNNGGLRVPLAEGAVTVGDIYRLMPFENKLVILGLTSAEMQTFLDDIALQGGEGLAGLQMVINNGKAENIQIEGKPLNAYKDKIIYMVTSDYLANGGGGEILKHASERTDCSVLLRDVIIQYIEMINQKGEKISAATDGRIVITGNAKNN